MRDPIDKAFEQWLQYHRGEPMTSVEIAKMACMDDSSIRWICNRACEKLKRYHATPAILEYADE